MLGSREGRRMKEFLGRGDVISLGIEQGRMVDVYDEDEGPLFGMALRSDTLFIPHKFQN